MKGKVTLTNIKTEHISDKIIEASLDEWHLLREVEGKVEHIRKIVNRNDRQLDRIEASLRTGKPLFVRQRKEGLFERFGNWLFGE